MSIIYDAVIFIFRIFIRFAAPFHAKAKLRRQGLQRQKEQLASIPGKQAQTIWMHCASLGEFEQGRPLLEKIKTNNPETRIVLTFFSPSGYEKRKEYLHADYVFYLPDDTKKNARRFIQAIQPDAAIFVKYEFWYRHLQALHKHRSKIYLIAGIFRENQIFFKTYGKFFRKLLNFFTRLYVQDEASLKMLKNIELQKITVAGDPRFDRVLEIAEKAEPIKTVQKFLSGKPLIVAGSTWPHDEQFLTRFAENRPDVQIIFAPHEIHSERIQQLEKMLPCKSFRYSAVQEMPEPEVDYLIIDNVGMLSKLYRYADVCYIGGGFGAGIHNTLEAAVYGKPVVFGPKYKKFSEAVDLHKRGAGFPVSNYKQLENCLKKLLFGNAEYRKQVGQKAEEYCREMAGSTNKIYQSIRFDIPSLPED